MEEDDFDDDLDRAYPKIEASMQIVGDSGFAAMVAREAAQIYANKEEQAMIKLTRELQQKVAGLVEEKFREKCASLVEEEVSRAMSEGWTVTNTWGDKTGEHWTLRSHVMKYLAEKRRDSGSSYNAPEKTVIDRAVEEAVKRIFSQEFDKEIADARARLRQMLDDSIAKKLAETLKSALGLR